MINQLQEADRLTQDCANVTRILREQYNESREKLGLERKEKF